MTSIQDLLSKHDTRLKSYTDTLFPENKARVLAAIKAAGVTQVTVEFNGSGDSGQIDNILGLPATVVPISVELHDLNLWGVGDPSVTTHTDLAQMIDRFSYDVIDAAGHGGWENNDGASGTIVFNVETSTIEFEINSYYTESEFSSETF